MQHQGDEATIAVIEDDAGLNQAMARLLQAAGFTPVAFTCAEQFLAADIASRVDCLVIDLHLPGISGLELYQRLVQAGISCPAIFITAHDDRNLRLQACAVGKYLVKPFVGQALLHLIETVLADTAKARAAMPVQITHEGEPQ